MEELAHMEETEGEENTYQEDEIVDVGLMEG
jgi:hypothetical protein